MPNATNQDDEQHYSHYRVKRLPAEVLLDAISTVTESPESFAGSQIEEKMMASRARVVLTDYVWESLDVERKILGELGELTPFKSAKPDEFLAEAKDCDALLNTCAGPISTEVIAQMPKCRIIARYGIGVDTIDLEAATRSGIIATNNPTYCIEEVAEHAMALLLAAARKIAFMTGRFALVCGLACPASRSSVWPGAHLAATPLCRTAISPNRERKWNYRNCWLLPISSRCTRHSLRKPAS